jgi:hypothetical protein
MRTRWRRLARAGAALLLLAATLAAAPHGHLAPAPDATPCATCVFAGSSGAFAVAPRLPPPAYIAPVDPAPLVVSPGFAPPPLEHAPKNGPPRA